MSIDKEPKNDKVLNRKQSFYFSLFLTIMTIGVSVGLTWGIMTVIYLNDEEVGLINPLDVTQKYVLKENATKLDGVESSSVLDEYVSKELINENYLLKHDKEEVDGLTKERSFNPADVTNRYLLLPNTENLRGVSSKSVYDEYISKEDVTNNYYLKYGEKNSNGIYSDEEYDPSSSVVSNEEIEKGEGTGNVLYTILSIPRKNIILPISSFYNVPVGSTASFGYLTDDPDSKVPLKSIRLKKGVTRVYYLLTSLFQWKTQDSGSVKEGITPYFYGVKFSITFNNLGTIVTSILEVNSAVKTTSSNGLFSWNDGSSSKISWKNENRRPVLKGLINGLTQVSFREKS